MLTIGVLIDASTVPSDYATPAIAGMGQFGQLGIKRAYADWGTLGTSSWARELDRHAIAPMERLEHSAGRHASRDALAIHALDLHHSRVLDGFALVCGDDSYAELAARLRDAGAVVVGAGRGAPSSSFARSCSRYLDLDDMLVDASTARAAMARAAMARPA